MSLNLKMKMVNLMILTVCIMISIAFFTLMERKMISYSQNRKGPNKTSLIGIIQPMADAVKLMGKEINLNIKSNFIMYLISPTCNIFISLITWMVIPFMFNFNFMKMSIIFIMICTSINTITIMVMSWASNSNYSYLGMMRTIAQMISYEINLMMILIILINLTEQMNLNLINQNSKYFPMVTIVPNIFVIWIIVILAETNRTPFDFSEGESELISGFNIEFSSKSFMMLFLAEYSSILMMSMLTTSMFFTSPEKLTKYISIYLIFSMMFIWTRTTFPRFRYDKLMNLNWVQLLPTTTFMLAMSFTMKMFFAKKV